MLANDPQAAASTWAVRSPEDLGRALAGVRAARGISQEELAQATGMTRQYLSRLELGTSTLVVERLLRALRRMGAEVTVSVRPQADSDAD
jgi:transcriptional regulator with XRE-family HTH domain